METYEHARKRAIKELSGKRGTKKIELFISNPERTIAYIERKKRRARNPNIKRIYKQVQKEIKELALA